MQKYIHQSVTTIKPLKAEYKVLVKKPGIHVNVTDP